MILLKCAFKVTIGKFLGFVVHLRRVKPAKIKAIIELPSAEKHSGGWRISRLYAYIYMFISNFSAR